MHVSRALKRPHMTTDIATIDQANLPSPVQSGVGISAVARAEIDAQVATAKQYPRDVSQAIARAKGLATINKDTASRMFYSLNQDGESVRGPSVRLAEVFFSVYGNLSCGSKIVEITPSHVVVVGFAHDMETNCRVASEEIASIITKNGRRYGERMIVTTAKATMAKARRNAILQVIPRVFVDQVMQAAMRVAAGADQPKVDRWRDLAGRFAGQSVTDKQALSLIRRTGFSEMTDDDFASLESCLALIVDGEETIDSLMAATVTVTKNASTIDTGRPQ